jgi:hypothetical protein
MQVLYTADILIFERRMEFIGAPAKEKLGN